MRRNHEYSRVSIVKRILVHKSKSSNHFGGMQFGANSIYRYKQFTRAMGKVDTAFFRPSKGAWSLNQTTDGLTTVQFGVNGDKPLTNVFIF